MAAVSKSLLLLIAPALRSSRQDFGLRSARKTAHATATSVMRRSDRKRSTFEATSETGRTSEATSGVFRRSGGNRLLGREDRPQSHMVRRKKRRGWDSNPRAASRRPTVFKATRLWLNHAGLPVSRDSPCDSPPWSSIGSASHLCARDRLSPLESARVGFCRDAHFDGRTDLVALLNPLIVTSVLTADLAKVSRASTRDVRRISAWAAIIAVPTMIRRHLRHELRAHAGTDRGR
jgi:hypothetical protein